MTNEEINLDDLRLDGGTQPRGGINAAHVDELVADLEAGETLPPIGLVYDGDDYWPWDGFHRIQAHRRAGYGRIAAEVRQGTRRDAVLLSVGANAEHNALRRTNADKRRAVMTLLGDDEWAKWSGREVARRCRVGETLVREIKQSLRETRSEDEGTVTYTTKHGTTATMNTASIGRKATVDEKRDEVADAVAESDRRMIAVAEPDESPEPMPVAAAPSVVQPAARPASNLPPQAAEPRPRRSSTITLCIAKEPAALAASLIEHFDVGFLREVIAQLGRLTRTEITR